MLRCLPCTTLSAAPRLAHLHQRQHQPARVPRCCGGLPRKPIKHVLLLPEPHQQLPLLLLLCILPLQRCHLQAGWRQHFGNEASGARRGLLRLCSPSSYLHRPERVKEGAGSACTHAPTQQSVAGCRCGPRRTAPTSSAKVRVSRKCRAEVAMGPRALSDRNSSSSEEAASRRSVRPAWQSMRGAYSGAREQTAAAATTAGKCTLKELACSGQAGVALCVWAREQGPAVSGQHIRRQMSGRQPVHTWPLSSPWLRPTFAGGHALQPLSVCLLSRLVLVQPCGHLAQEVHTRLAHVGICRGRGRCRRGSRVQWGVAGETDQRSAHNIHWLRR